MSEDTISEDAMSDLCAKYVANPTVPIYDTNNPQSLSAQSLSENPMTTFMVGPEKKAMTIPTDLILERSPALCNLVTELVGKGQPGIITWEDVSEDVFSLFAEFLHTGTLEFQPHQVLSRANPVTHPEDSDPILLNHARVYLLALEYDMAQLQQTVLSRMYFYVMPSTNIRECGPATLAILRYVYENVLARQRSDGAVAPTSPTIG